jgi:hypothetical protein
MGAGELEEWEFRVVRFGRLAQNRGGMTSVLRCPLHVLQVPSPVG